MTTRSILPISLLSLATQFGCSSMGATPGGAQDNGLADTQITKGVVPRPEAFTVAGLLGEYDLPLESASVPCDKSLCIQAAYGVAPVLYQDKGAVFVQMGFSSGIDQATFKRSPLNLAVVVDRSGSMAGEKLSAVKTALNRLVDQLTEQDRLAIVLFDDRVDVIRASAPVIDPLSIKATIATIAARGSTNMAAALQAGFAQVQAYAGVLSDRVMLFTDAETNTGVTDQGAFVNLATTASEQGIGLTLFGVGIDLNQDLVLAITQLRGGSYFFLSDAQTIATIFDGDFDFMVTPLAYDLIFRLDPSPGFTVSNVYGYSQWQAGSTSVSVLIPTVFLSRKHGAIVVRLDAYPGAWPAGQPPLAELNLAYTSADSGERVQESFVAAYTGTDPLSDSVVFYSQRAVRKTIALVNTALAEAEASRLYYASSPSMPSNPGVLLLERTQLMLRSEGFYLEDNDLTLLADSVQNLEANIQAEQSVSRSPSTSTTTQAYPACAMGHASRPTSAIWLAFALLLCLRRRAR